MFKKMPRARPVEFHAYFLFRDSSAMVTGNVSLNAPHGNVFLGTELNVKGQFAVNANGARYDALITDAGFRLSGRENANWDAIWEAASPR